MQFIYRTFEIVYNSTWGGSREERRRGNEVEQEIDRVEKHLMDLETVFNWTQKSNAEDPYTASFMLFVWNFVTNREIILVVSVVGGLEKFTYHMIKKNPGIHGPSLPEKL